ncbi:MAG TPA: hypothetical protein VJS12_17430 [Steroidobacteraceae bacterium]|nr:hypothetical protein [Steroidobacteraceae bacterium]
MKASLILTLALLTAVAAAQTSDPVYIADLNQTHAGKMTADQARLGRTRADKHARAAKLTSLSDGAADELRLWVTWATFDVRSNGIATTGYVLTRKDAKVCRVDYPRKSMDPEGALCRSYAPLVMRTRALADLPRLSALADFAIDCGTQDGSWLLIDAVSSGKRFVVYANNADSCTGDAAKLVADVSERVATVEAPR